MPVSSSLVIAIPPYRGTAQADRISFNAGTVYAADGDDRITMLGTGRAFGGSDNDSFFMGNRAGQLAYGGFGNDFFSITGTGILRSYVKGGVGVDTVLIRGAITATVTDDAGTGNIRSVEQILSYSGGLTLHIEADATRVTTEIGGVGSTLDISANYVTASLGHGNDTVSVGGENNIVYTGRGDDLVDMQGVYQAGFVSTGAGNDRAVLRDAGSISMGDGNDTLDFYNGNMTMGGSAGASLGAGNDVVTTDYYIGAALDLGAGNDRVIFTGDIEYASILTGLGADTLVFERGLYFYGYLKVTDFNFRQDRLDTSDIGIEGLADVTRISQIGKDVVLFLADPGFPVQGFEIILANTLVSQVTDAIFV